MVSLKSSFMIFPSKPTPNGFLQLSECDQLHPWTHIPIVFFYKPDTSNFPIKYSIETMREALEQVLVHFYPVAGRLAPIEGGRFEIECNAMGVQLTEATSEADMNKYGGDYTPTKEMQELLPSIDYNNTPIEMLPLFFVQLTKFRCGGLCVGVKISHTLGDGMAIMHFINSWGKFARGDEKLEVRPFLNRTVVREKCCVTRFPHMEFSQPPPLNGCRDGNAVGKKETTVAMLWLTKDQVQRLKNKANLEAQNGRRPYTRYEAVTGHMWRCACKARAHDYDQATRIRFMVDCRNRLQPPLPPGYFGSCALPTVTPTCLSGDLVSKPLGYASSKVREGTEKMTDEYIRSALDFARSQGDVSRLRTSFHTVGTSQGFFSGNPNLNVTSWTGLPVYDADFGWGKPVYAGPGLVNSDGKSFIVSGCDGSLAVALRLQTEHMDIFRKYFNEI